MERLTEKHYLERDGHYMKCSETCYLEDTDCSDCKKFYALVDRLGAYEDTGLAPEEIKAALAANDTARVFVEKMTEFGGTEAVKRLRELAEADRDGRVVVLPCKVGDTVYFVLKDSPQFYPDTNGWYIGESKVLTVTDKGFCDGEVGVDCITPWDELGRTVFLTREEAEQALKEAKENG